jgi:leader peptidase (prepilin peptidase)/N-methyltransferase
VRDSFLDPAVVFTVFLGILGLLIGSFLNVVIARVPHGLSVVHPRSRCPKCGHQLAWFENIPVFSWLALRGKCRSCDATISPRYAAVEILTAALFLACLQRFGWTYELVPALVMVMVLVPLTFIDLEHWLLPFALTVPGIALGLVLSVPMGAERVITSAIGASAGWLSFFLLEIVGEKIFKKEALGGGDKYLLSLLGAFLGWKSLLGIIFLSSMQGALVGSLLLLFRGRAGPAPASGPSLPPDQPGEGEDWQPGPTNIPFGPWLALAGLEILLLGPWLASVLPRTLGWIFGGEFLVE